MNSEQAASYQQGGANSPYINSYQQQQYANYYQNNYQGQQVNAQNQFGYGAGGGFYGQGQQNMNFGKRKKRQMPGKTNQPGMVIDPILLDNITRDIQEGYNGARGWRAEHAFIVTWYRVSFEFYIVG